MEVELPDGCGNAPRIGVVAGFVEEWARGDTDAVLERLADDAVWAFVGAGTYTGQNAASRTGPGFSPDRLMIETIITHGRFASCDGCLEEGNRRLAFSHVLRFSGASKTARISEARSYLIETAE